MKKKNNIEELIEQKKATKAKKEAKAALNAKESIAPKPAKTTKKINTVKIIPLGGVDGIGMNMTAFEYGDDIIVVDCGISFPREDMPGVDVVIPDFSYLVRNADKIRGLVLTHGHEDHIGAVPYLLKKLHCDVFGTRLTLGILDGKLNEHNIRTEDLYEVRAGEMLALGVFDVEFIHVNHSMPDAIALCINTPCGRIVHTGDFKIDFTPIGTTPIDLGRFAELGRKGVKLLLCDSTNAERPGYTPSESSLTASFDRIFQDDTRRVVIATFSSNVHRVQQILEACARHGRKVALTGRSLQNVLRAAQQLGYIDIPEGLV
ncbi:MAG: ribonuclease J, partial [Clostridia bacterium]|nr:ribonuclease J [Clostridia bacterium]